MTVEQTLKDMLKDTNKHKRPKENLLEHFVSMRLDKSIQTYYKQLLESVDYLANREASQERILNGINKEEKNDL